MSDTLKIGNVEIARTAALAPMAGVADRAYRLMCKKYGAAYVVSEMVSAKGICYSDRKTAELCTVTDEERPMAIQLFGSEPEFMAEAVKIVLDYHPDIIDINMGCPVPKVVGTGAGSALMKDIKLAAAVTEAAVKAAGDTPVTVKIRSGWSSDSINATYLAWALEAVGAAAITVHGRTRDMYYSGSSDNSVIKAVKSAVSIPVIGNGDVTDFKSCREMYEQTGCDLVMIGRGSYGNPFLFREIEAGMKGTAYTPPTLEEKMQVMLEHIRLILELSEKCEELAMHEARKHAAWYMNGYYGSAKFRGRCYQLSSYAEAEALAEEFIELQRSREINIM
ncbi:putative TIM-barrel protein, nifR3 family [Ruminococcus flavefaciens]|uniref:tRNA-dihydrouridine synthase n=1 Tax=Ruminococcus flavefaciens TaxID=1265 RepID=A0A1H6IEJ8_RUMFL|nr:tRNA dihydrouridine synthase DusB [Ruminococcus flavefaciens]SEH44872.1 putative TIM-barrel protein, nifR3 family [Ruminococcus flavefaciens]